MTIPVTTPVVVLLWLEDEASIIAPGVIFAKALVEVDAAEVDSVALLVVGVPSREVACMSRPKA